MKRTAYADDMQLIGFGNNGSQIALNGVPGINNVGSVEDVFDLVEQNLVCIIGADSQVSAQFFWNPKAVLDTLSDEKLEAEANCIPPA